MLLEKLALSKGEIEFFAPAPIISPCFLATCRVFGGSKNRKPGLNPFALSDCPARVRVGKWRAGLWPGPPWVGLNRIGYRMYRCQRAQAAWPTRG